MNIFDKNNDLTIWFAISLALHLLVIGIFSTINKTSAIKREFYAPTIKVDLVTLERPKPVLPKKKVVPPPKKTVPKPGKAEKKIKKEAKPIKKTAPKAKPKKKTEKLPDPSETIKNLRKKHEEEISVEEKLAEVRSKVDESRKSAAISDKVSTTPKVGIKKVDASNMEKEIKAYSDLLYEKMHNAWVLPGNTDYSGLSTIISVTIGKNGELLKVYIEEGSGNGFFDQSVLRAVEKSSPFPSPPKGYEGGMDIGFRFSQ